MLKAGYAGLDKKMGGFLPGGVDTKTSLAGAGQAAQGAAGAIGGAAAGLGGMFGSAVGGLGKAFSAMGKAKGAAYGNGGRFG